jgi:RNA polymerase sigma factor (sigma-70 family)
MSIDLDGYYRTYGPMVLRRCRQILKDEDLAADAMQDTFLRLIQRKDRVYEEAPSSLLYTIATNVSLNRIRSNRRRPMDLVGETVEDIAVTPDETDRVIDQAMIEHALAGLTGRSRSIATDYFIHGKTMDETALHCGLSISGVRKRLQRVGEHARRRLVA